MNNSFKNSFISDTFLSLINSLGLFLKPFALLYLINNYIGTDSYGLIAVFLSSVSLLTIISSLGVGLSMRRHILSEVDIEKRRNYFFYPINFQLLIMFIYAITAILFFGLTNLLPLNDLFIYILYFFSFSLFQYFLEYRRWILNAKGYIKISLFSALSFLIIIFIGFASGYITNIFQILILDSLVMILIFIYLFYFISKELGFTLKTFNTYELKSEVRLGLPFALGGLGEVIISSSDRYVILYFLTLLETGLYSVSYMIASLPLIFVKVIGLFIPQHMFKNRDNQNFKAVNSLINIQLLLYLAISLPFVIFLFFFGNNILAYLNIYNISAYYSLIILSFASIFFGMYLLLTSITLMEKKTLIQMKIMLFFAIFNLLTNFISILIFQTFLAASITTLVTNIFLFIFFISYLRKIWTFSFPFLILLKLVIIFVTSIFLSFIAFNISQYNILIFSIFILIYILLNYLLIPWSKLLFFEKASIN